MGILIKNITELKGRKGTKDASVTLIGKTSPTDGLGGEFYWDDTAADSADDNLVVQVAGVATGRWKRVAQSASPATVVGTATFSGKALIIVDFNSIGAGRGSNHEITSPDDYSPGPFAYTMMNALTAAFPAATFAKKNFSVSGRQTPTMISQSGRVYAMFAPSVYDRQIIVFGEGGNHIADGGVSALDAYNALVDYAKAGRAKGFTMVPTTLLRRTSNFASGMSAATYNERADIVNALLRANYLQYSDVLADIATLNVTLPDGTHPDDNGYVTIGNYIANKVAPLVQVGFNPQSIPFLLSGSTGSASATPATTTPVLLLRGQGTNNSTSIVDEGTPVHTMTANNTARISTAQYKFGSSSIYFDGGVNTHVSTPSSSDFDFGMGDFTMEAWIYKTSNGSGYPAIFARGDNTQNQWTLCFPEAGARLDFYVGNGGTGYARQNLNHSVDVPLNQWVHIALVSSGGVRKLYQGGTLVGTATTNNSLETNTTGKPLRVGFLPAAGQAQDSGDRFIGHMHARITKSALYTGNNFTVPASF